MSEEKVTGAWWAGEDVIEKPELNAEMPNLAMRLKNADHIYKNSTFQLKGVSSFMYSLELHLVVDVLRHILVETGEEMTNMSM